VGVLVGICIIHIACPFLKIGGCIEPTAGGLANMREHFRFGHHWDAAKGQWTGDGDQRTWAIQLTMSNSQFH
jgi:hypothetical protein